MIRQLLPLSFVALILAAGCSTPPAAPVATLPTQPGLGTVAATPTEELKAVGIEVKSTRIYVDAVSIMETRDGIPVINVAHASEAGRAAMAALQEAFTTRGFRSVTGEFTSMGLGGSPKQILLTHGSQAPAPATLPVIISQNVSDTQRAEWIASLFSAVHVSAAGRPVPATLAATYLSPNLNRIEVFAALSGGGGSRAQIWVAAFDSRTGHVLWSGSASENASVLDIAVATSLVRSVVHTLPLLPVAATRS